MISRVCNRIGYADRKREDVGIFRVIGRCECRRNVLIYGHVVRETPRRISLPPRHLDYNQPFYPRLSMSLISIITQTLKSQYPPPAERSNLREEHPPPGAFRTFPTPRMGGERRGSERERRRKRERERE